MSRPCPRSTGSAISDPRRTGSPISSRPAGQNYWQVLPLNHTTASKGHSPYSGISAFAGNPLLISPDLLYQDGLLRKAEISDLPRLPAETVDYREGRGLQGRDCSMPRLPGSRASARSARL